MRKRQISPTPPGAAPSGQAWLDVDSTAFVEVTSEENEYPIESALLGAEDRGWRASRSIPWLLLAIVMLAMPAASFAQVLVSITTAPPELPVYEQPICTGEGYIWTPGYWAYGPEGYFWVPGTWVLVPEPGLLWTPGYWVWSDGLYVWHAGYWGPQVGFYGGVNYGYGYSGTGYQGAYWNNGALYYNRSVNNVNATNVHNVYNTTVVNNTTANNVSYNGGTGGTTARPTAAELAGARAQRVPPTAEQTQHERAASTNRAQLASVNHGQPPVAATAKPGVFTGHGVEATGTPQHPVTNGAAAKDAGTPSATPEHPNVATPSYPNNNPPPKPAPHSESKPQPESKPKPASPPPPPARGNPPPPEEKQKPKPQPPPAG
jgi:WXXGXW repeat (2 copies)